MTLKELQKQFTEFEIKQSRKQIISLKNKARFSPVLLEKFRGYGIFLTKEGIISAKLT
jgi:hypothetical protein